MFGVHGELKLDASRIGVDAVRAGLRATVLMPGGALQAVTIAVVRLHKGRPLVTLAGVVDATAAEAFVRGELLIPRSAAALGAGEYFDDDLVGCALIDREGRSRGTVVEVAHHPAQDVLLVGPGRAMLPLVRAFVREIDVAAKTIRIDVPPGLLDPENAAEA